jgi:hypothetical protein
MAHDVFVSYSSADKAVADAVCAALEGRGIRCWIAPRDIVPGVDWGASIIDAINGARVMVLVFSANANQSRQISREVERAVAKGVTIVPFRIQDVPMSKTFEYFISTPHWFDALTPPLEDHLARLADTVQVLIDRGSRDSTAVPIEKPATAKPKPPPPFAGGAVAGAPARGRRVVGFGALALALAAVVFFLLPRGRPKILALEFPSSVTAGVRKTGSIQFEDGQGDVVAAEFQVVEAGDFKDFRVQPKLSGEKEGRFTFSLRAASPQQVTLRAVLVDAAGNKSSPYRFSFDVVKAAAKPAAKPGFEIDTGKFKIKVPGS